MSQSTPEGEALFITTARSFHVRTSFLQLRAISDMLGSPFSMLVQYRMCLTILEASCCFG